MQNYLAYFNNNGIQMSDDFDTLKDYDRFLRNTGLGVTRKVWFQNAFDKTPYVHKPGSNFDFQPSKINLYGAGQSHDVNTWSLSPKLQDKLSPK